MILDSFWHPVDLGQIAAVATAVGVVIAGWQLWLARRIAVIQFEDQVSSQYRTLIRGLPVGALLGEELTEREHQECLATFYHYFDLSNEQAFLHEKRRIRHDIWVEWKSGIEQNLKRPAFKRAWAEISQRAPDSFDELRRAFPPHSIPVEIEAVRSAPRTAHNRSGAIG